MSVKTILITEVKLVGFSCLKVASKSEALSLADSLKIKHGNKAKIILVLRDEGPDWKYLFRDHDVLWLSKKKVTLLEIRQLKDKMVVRKGKVIKFYDFNIGTAYPMKFLKAFKSLCKEYAFEGTDFDYEWKMESL